MARKRNELSSREDFVVEQFPTMKKVNTICSKIFELYFIDTDIDNEMSVMMRNMVPAYYIDPSNPEHPSCFILAGKSLVDYLERMVYVFPYVNNKGKYEYDLSGYRGLLFNPTEFTMKVKGFRKTKLEPMVITTEVNGERINQSLVMREDVSGAKEEHIIPFLMVPNRKRDGDIAYRDATKKLVYDPFYRYLPDYLQQDLQFIEIPQGDVVSLIENDEVEFVSEDDDRIIVSKDLFPGLKIDHKFAIAKVHEPKIDTSGGRFHYIIREDFINENGMPFISSYTLLAALQF